MPRFAVRASSTKLRWPKSFELFPVNPYVSELKSELAELNVITEYFSFPTFAVFVLEVCAYSSADNFLPSAVCLRRYRRVGRLNDSNPHHHRVYGSRETGRVLDLIPINILNYSHWRTRYQSSRIFLKALLPFTELSFRLSKESYCGCCWAIEYT
jgi:hypothetical protein